jgi:hypothetical protein
MPFLEKIADITMSGQHVGDMSATFPAKLQTPLNLPLFHRHASICTSTANTLQTPRNCSRNISNIIFQQAAPVEHFNLVTLLRLDLIKYRMIVVLYWWK